MHDPASTRNEQVRVAMNTSRLKRRQGLTLVLCLAFAAASAGYCVLQMRSEDGQPLVAVIAGLWAVTVLALAIGIIVRWRQWNGHRCFVFSPVGLTYEIGDADVFEATWPEVEGIRLTVTTKPAALGTGPKRSQVRLVVRLSDPEGFRARHPEVHRNALMPDLNPAEHGITLLEQTEVVAPLDQALRGTAGDRYQGVVRSTVRRLGRQ